MSYVDHSTFLVTPIRLQNGNLDVTLFIPTGKDVSILQDIEPISRERLNENPEGTTCRNIYSPENGEQVLRQLQTLSEQSKRIFDPENFQVDSVSEPEQNAEPATELPYHAFSSVTLDDGKMEITYFVPYGKHIPPLDGLNPISQTKLNTSKGGTMHRAVYSSENVQEIRNRLDSCDEAGHIKKEGELLTRSLERSLR